jgi:hypothetical protein
MIKVRKLVDITLNDKDSKIISLPSLKEKYKGEGCVRVCKWIQKNLKTDLSGPTERCFILTFKNGGLVGVYLVGMGNEHTVKVRNMDILDLALQDDADFIIDLHNHTDIGKVKISEADIRALSEYSQFYRSINIIYWMLICNKNTDAFTYYYWPKKEATYEIKTSTQKMWATNNKIVKVPNYEVKKSYDSVEIHLMEIHIGEEQKKPVARKKPKEKQLAKKTETKTKRRVTPQKSVKE